MRNMKKTAFFLLLAVCGLWACNDNWNDYYDGSSVSGSVDTATTVLDCSIIEFSKPMPSMPSSINSFKT